MTVNISYDPTVEADVALVSKINGMIETGAAEPVKVTGAVEPPEFVLKDEQGALSINPVPNETVAAEAEPVSPTAGPEPELDARVGVELDKNGTPWLAEVHAGTKSQTKDGIWTKKRGVDQEICAQTEAAARAKLAGTPEPVEQVDPVMPEPDLPAPVDYETLTQKYITLATAGLIDTTGMTAIYEECGTSGGDLATNETARAAVMQRLVALENTPVAAPTMPGMPQ